MTTISKTQLLGGSDSARQPHALSTGARSGASSTAPVPIPAPGRNPDPTNRLASIEHIVVLMLENRSFDHMLGLLYADSGNVSPANQPFDGLTGKESNPASDGTSITVFAIDPTTANHDAMPGADPGEGYQATNLQLFGANGAPNPPVATNQGFVNNFGYTLGWEAQKPSWAPLPGTVAADIMGIYTPEMLPVLSALAKGFAVCDQWFSSVPTETLPNRAFACAATSQGHMDDTTKTFTAPSIFGLMSTPPMPLRAISVCSRTFERTHRRDRWRHSRSWSRTGARPETASIRTTASRRASN
jgi:phospholipase C